MSIYSIYFSPTGGVKRVMTFVGEEISVDKQIDLSVADDNYTKYNFSKEDVCLIGVPSFGGRVPAIVLERMRQMKANGTTAILVVVFGNREFDDTLLELKNEAIDCGFIVGAAITAVAEHSIMRQFAKARPDAQDQKELQQFSKEIAKLISEKETLKDFEVPGNTEYREYSGVPFKPKANKDCTKCGICAKKCPVNAIPKNNPSSLEKDKCISCMRCISVCPENARKLNKVALFGASQAMKKKFVERKSNKFYS